MEVECEFVAQDWDGIIPALLANKYDAIVASMSITEERKRVVSFTDKYYSNQARFVAGKNIGAQRATIAASWLEENAGGAQVKLYDTQENVFLDLTSGRLDAVFGDGLMLYEWLQTDAGVDYRLVGDAHRLDEGIGIAVRKEDDELRKRLNIALAAILANATYARIIPFSIH